MTLLAGLGWALAGALLLLLLTLAAPVDLVFDLERIDRFTGVLRWRVLFGLVRLRVELPAAARPGREVPDVPGRAARSREPGQGPMRLVRAYLGDSDFRRRVHRLLADLRGDVRPAALRLRLRVGLDDPADTGRLWALLGPLGAIAAARAGADLRLEPDFTRPVLQWQASGRVRVVPLRSLWVLGAFVLSPATRRAWQARPAG